MAIIEIGTEELDTLLSRRLKGHLRLKAMEEECIVLEFRPLAGVPRGKNIRLHNKGVTQGVLSLQLEPALLADVLAWVASLQGVTVQSGTLLVDSAGLLESYLPGARLENLSFGAQGVRLELTLGA